MITQFSLFFQGLTLALITQFVFGLSADNSASRSPSAASSQNGANIFRSAALKTNGEKEGNLLQPSRNQRCLRCGTAGYYGSGTGGSGYGDR